MDGPYSLYACVRSGLSRGKELATVAGLYLVLSVMLDDRPAALSKDYQKSCKFLNTHSKAHSQKSGCKHICKRDIRRKIHVLLL